MVYATSLPPKDYAAFKQVLVLYESKSYKKALKEADKLLSKHPRHGETISMKGLILNSINQKHSQKLSSKLIKRSCKL